MDDSTRHDDIAERLGALGQWQPPSSVGLTTVVRAGRRRRATRVAGMGGLAAVVVVATTVSALALGGGRGVAPADSTPTTATSTPLDTPTTTVNYAPAGANRAAMAAAAPDPAKALDESSWADAPYWYYKIRVQYAANEANPAEDYVQEVWTGHHSDGLILIDGDVLGGIDPGGWPLADFDRETDGDAWEAFFALPTDPDALEAALRAAVPMVPSGGWTPGPDAPTQDDRVWAQIRDLYAGSPASTELRLALLQVAEGLSGTVVTPGVTDGEGRVGLAVSRPFRTHTDSGTDTMIIDPTDGTVLEERDGMVGDDPSYRTTYQAMGPAWSLPVQPTLPPGCTSWNC